MVQTVVRTRNFNDDAVIETAEANPTTSTTLIAANPLRVFLEISLDAGTSDVNVFVKLQAANIDNDKKGIVLSRRTGGNDTLDNTRWQMPPDNIYTGEISIITDIGTVDVHVTEY